MLLETLPRAWTEQLGFAQPGLVVKFCVTLRLRQWLLESLSFSPLQSISGELEILCRKKGSAGPSSLVLHLSCLAVKQNLYYKSVFSVRTAA